MPVPVRLAADQDRSFRIVFPTALGWMAVLGAGEIVKQLTFGHPSRQAAIRALGSDKLAAHVEPAAWAESLVEQLGAYAAGAPVDFRDVEIDPGPLTDFQRRVLRQCRRVAYGRTMTYGQLAARAGFAGAARAVGNCMAANRVPLIVPCHRVIPANGKPGAFSAPGGTLMKQRLLAMEARRGLSGGNLS